MFKLSTAALVSVTLFAAMAPVRTAPAPAGSLVKDNALQAQQLNAKFSSMRTTDSCQGNEQACINGAFAQCVQGKWSVHAPCASNLRCYALPLVLKPGVALVCDTPDGAERRFKDAGVSGGVKGTGAAAPIDDDEEIEDCEEEDELEGRMFAEDDDYHYFYKRQVASEPSTLAELPSSPQQTGSSSPSSAASAVITSSAAAVTPTVVIGTDGIVTVTVVSTVFAAPTACANTGAVSASALPTAVTVSRASPLSSVSARASSIVSSAASVRPTAFSSSSAPRPSNAIPLSAVTTASSVAPSPSAVNNGGGFSFTFARRSIATAGAA